LGNLALRQQGQDDKRSAPRGRQLYSPRIGTVEPVFANLRHSKRQSRLNHRRQAKVRTQWSLYCMVHNIEKLAGLQARGQ